MKFRYKVLIILAAFGLFLFLFSSGVTKTVFATVARTTKVEGSTLPTISFEVEGMNLNRLHGYVSNTDEMVMRETITPMTTDRSFTVLIDQNGCDVKKLKYEIYTEEGKKLDSGTYTVLEDELGKKSVPVLLNEGLKTGSEYVAKITLITNTSKRINYYTRLKAYENGRLFEKMDFVTGFHNTLLTGTAEEREKLKKYLESSKTADNSSFANVNIKSSFTLVNYGELEPVVVWEDIPSITEFYDSMATVVLNFVVSAETDYGTEYYTVTERYRFNYTDIRTYLYNYERSMETLYDVTNTSLAKDEFKLGITADINAATGASPSRKFLAFVYGHELLLYSTAENSMTTVFSFREEGEDTFSRLYDHHRVRLLNVYDNGNVDLVVYGYMNRGEYEGRVGIILYKYIYEDNRLEEQLYIPVETSYGLLESDLADFFYLSDKDIFYFSLYDSIYAYDLITAKLNILAEDVPAENLIYVPEEKFIAWQSSSDPTEAECIRILMLDTGELSSIDAGDGCMMRIFGRTNNNIVYGYNRLSDVYVFPDGSSELPAFRLCIADKNGNVLKTYEEPGYFISGVVAEDNILTIERVSLSSEGGYTEAEPDSIVNRIVAASKPVSLSKRVTDRVLTEYYVSIPSGNDIKTVPSMRRSLNTIINRDTTTRLIEPEGRTFRFYAYSFGNVVYSSSSAQKTITQADLNVGTVVNRNGRLIWERGVKGARMDVTGLVDCRATDIEHSMAAAMQMLIEHSGQPDSNTTAFDRSICTTYEWLRDNMKATPVDLTGATLDEVLYYVYKNRPVFAILESGEACLITGYDKSTVTIYSPVSGKYTKLELDDAQDSFSRHGNIFISYVK